MSDVGLDLAIFLDALPWGNDYLVVDGKARYERSVLTHSGELPWILDQLEKKSQDVQEQIPAAPHGIRKPDLYDQLKQNSNSDQPPHGRGCRDLD